MRKVECEMRKEITFPIPHSHFPIPISVLCHLFSVICSLSSVKMRWAMKKVLVINSGSSSIKYQLFDMSDKTVLARGLLERIGEPVSCLTHHTRQAQGDNTDTTRKLPVENHRAGFKVIGEVLNESGAVRDSGELFGIGHRVVHGGEAFQQPALIDEKVIATIRELIPLAPLHNPANLTGIEVALQFAPTVPPCSLRPLCLRSQYLTRPFISPYHRRHFAMRCPMIFIKIIRCAGTVFMGRLIVM